MDSETMGPKKAAPRKNAKRDRRLTPDQLRVAKTLFERPDPKIEGRRTYPLPYRYYLHIPTDPSASAMIDRNVVVALLLHDVVEARVLDEVYDSIDYHLTLLGKHVVALNGKLPSEGSRALDLFAAEGD